ncbi:MAG: cytidine deaminase [Clostridia bacterium]|nr:cytidine deaminase [Clostridia bacterium]
MTFDKLISHARTVLNPRQIARNASAGGVAAALLTEKGHVYTGVCIDTACGMGFCAEHAAIAAMITAGESRIIKIVAIGAEGVMPPCGRCREFMNQIHDQNMLAEVMVSGDAVVTLRELLPFHY